MKKTLLVLIAALILVTSGISYLLLTRDAARAASPSPPTLTKSAFITQGTLTICFASPTSPKVVPCTSKGAVPAPFTTAGTGESTADNAGNSCATTVNDTTSPGTAFPPLIELQFTVGKQMDFDPTTQTGDVAFTTWVGKGSCKGATFINKGAAVVNTGTAHFVISNKGARTDSIVTSITATPKGSIGAFSLTAFSLLQ